MTDTIAELRKLLGKATAGPLASRIEPKSYPECDDKDYPATISGNGKHIAFLQERYDANLVQVNDVDAALIVAMRNNIEALLDRVEAGEVAIAALQKAEIGLKLAEEAMREMFRYYDGGETRGSYDGKPERNGLRKAWHQVRLTLSDIQQKADTP